MTVSPTKELAGWVANLSYGGLPPSVVAHIKLCILDTIGCGLFGSTLPWGRLMADFARKLGGQEEATVWGYPFKTSSPNAALANGTMVHGFELDDLHKDGIVHPGSISLPSALAVAERAGCSGKEFLASVVAGYEVAARVGMAAGVSHLVRGYHPTGTHGTFGAAAAAGKVLNLDEGKMLHALGIAGTQGAGLMAAQYSAMVKRMHAGRAAQSGVYGALLAQMGFTGITDILEADYGGYCKVMSDSFDLSKLTQGLGQSYETLNVGFKSYACCGSNHTSLEAVEQIMNGHGIQPDLIDKITIRTTQATKLHVGWEYRPESITTAQMNLSYCLAVMALEGEAFVDQFTEEKIGDARILDFVKRVEVHADPELDKLGPAHRHTIVAQIRCKDGRSFSQRVDHAKGSQSKPMTPAEVVKKFRTLAGKVLKGEQMEELLRMVNSLEKLSDMRGLAQMLVP